MSETALVIMCYVAGFITCIMILALIVALGAPRLEQRDEQRDEMQYRLAQTKAHWGDETQRGQMDDDALQ